MYQLYIRKRLFFWTHFYLKKDTKKFFTNIESSTLFEALQRIRPHQAFHEVRTQLLIHLSLADGRT